MGLVALDALLGIGNKILDRVFPDPIARETAKLELLKMQQNGELAQLAAETELAKGQMEINTIEAGSEHIFVSGWRPFIGWVCGIAFSYHFVLQPLIAFVLANTGHEVVLPVFDMNALFTVLMGMLGLGGLRTYEKIKSV